MLPLHSRIAALAALLCSLCAATVTHGATLPTGFAETRVATGLTNPTAMAVAPDGRIFVAQQGGALRVVKNGALLAQPFVTVSVSSVGERGLLGVAFDPNFASNNFVYVYYTTSSSPIHNRVSRFTASAANADVAAAGSEVQILNLPNLSSASNHNGGAIHFGTDGKLYIAVGENANSSNAPSLNTTLGKILRINADGSIPSDNPFLSQTTGINQAIWARGLRNPFTFGIDPTNGRIHVNDVGEGTWEEVNQGVAGSNYGWPQTEGNNPAGVAGVRYPIHTFDHSGGVCAITGGSFYRPTTATFPAEYAGRYFFGDFCAGFIRTLSPPNYTASTGFATGISSLADIQVHSDGSLYYLARGGGGELFRVQFTAATAPSISSHPANITVAAGQSATFAVTASGTAPLAYQWQRNGVNIAGANARTYTLTTTAADNGVMFRVLVSNATGSALSNSATLTVLSNSAPRGTITAPTNGTTYRGGQVFTFASTGTDPEDGNLPPSAFTWRVDFHHDDHVHPHVPDTSGNTGTFTIANRGETSANVFYRVILTVRDSSGLTHTSQVDVRPLTSVVRIESNVTNAQLTLDGAPITAPFSFTGVEGVIRTLGVVTPQTSGGITYDFANWSDGGQATHEVVTPNNDTTFTAMFQPAVTTTLFSDTFEAASGWTLTAGANTAPRGRWQRGDPQATTFNGTTLQLGTCDGPSVNCFITGLAAGSAVGSADVDEGMTSVQSPAVALPAGATVTLRFRYFLAHNNNATSADYFRVRVVGTSGQPQTVFTRPGAGGVVRGGAWTTQTVALTAFAGQTVRLRFEAADTAAGSIIEAGFDNVAVTRQ